jgi:hypothetical protein
MTLHSHSQIYKQNSYNYDFHLLRTNPCTKIVKEQNRSKIKIAKYLKNLFKPAVRDNSLHRTI